MIRKYVMITLGIY